MSSKQTRRSISVSGLLYQALKARAAREQTTISGLVERTMALYVNQPSQVKPVKAKTSTAPLPSKPTESKKPAIVVGDPPVEELENALYAGDPVPKSEARKGNVRYF